MEPQQQHHRALVALAATTGAAAACLLAHRLWMRHQGAESLQQVLGSSTWIPQLLLQGSSTSAVAASPAALAAQQQAVPVLYDWAQSVEEVLVEAQLPGHIQPQDVDVKFGPRALLVVVGQQRVIDGCLAGPILPPHSSWRIEGQGRSRKLSITLVKQPAAAAAGAAAAGSAQQRYVLWDSLLSSSAAAEDDAPRSPEKRDQVAKALGS